MAFACLLPAALGHTLPMALSRMLPMKAAGSFN
jgi:hypothetical protein